MNSFRFFKDFELDRAAGHVAVDVEGVGGLAAQRVGASDGAALEVEPEGGGAPPAAGEATRAAERRDAPRRVQERPTQVLTPLRVARAAFRCRC